MELTAPKNYPLITIFDDFPAYGSKIVKRSTVKHDVFVAKNIFPGSIYIFHLRQFNVVLFL